MQRNIEVKELNRYRSTVSAEYVYRNKLAPKSKDSKCVNGLHVLEIGSVGDPIIVLKPQRSLMMALKIRPVSDTDHITIVIEKDEVSYEYAVPDLIDINVKHVQLVLCAKNTQRSKTMKPVTIGYKINRFTQTQHVLLYKHFLWREFMPSAL